MSMRGVCDVIREKVLPVSGSNDPSRFSSHNGHDLTGKLQSADLNFIASFTVARVLVSLIFTLKYQ